MRGYGSVRQRSQHLWEARISQRTAAGDRTGVSEYFKTERDAYDGLERMRQTYGTMAADSKETLGSHLSSWLRRKEKIWAPATYRLNEPFVNERIIPALGKITLSKLTVRDIDTFMDKLGDEGIGDASRNSILRTLSQALNDAVRQELITRNVAKNALKPKPPKNSKIILDLEQAQHLLKVAKKSSRYYALYVLAITGGLRQGELFALLWENVKLTGPTPSVKIEANLALAADGVTLERKEPKTKASKRTIPIPQIAVDALKTIYRGKQHSFVFTDTLDNPLRKSNFLRREFFPLLEEANLPRITFHSLRHVG